MLDYSVQPNSRRCCITGRELKPGEQFYSVLVDDDGKLTRLEYSLEAWQKPPEKAFSYWTGRVPVSDKESKPAIDDTTLMECFTRLEGCEDLKRTQFRYILALLLMRRKQLKFEEACQSQGREVLRLKEVGSKTIHEVTNPDLQEDEIAEVQEEVFKVLGW